MCLSADKKIARLEKKVAKKEQATKIAQLRDRLVVLDSENDVYRRNRENLHDGRRN